jgi:hypothetical protein
MGTRHSTRYRFALAVRPSVPYATIVNGRKLKKKKNKTVDTDSAGKAERQRKKKLRV